MLLEGQYEGLDVLHLGYYLKTRHSIRKIIENIICNCHTLKQRFISFDPRKKGADECLTLDLINSVRPKILHLHFSSIFDPSLFRRLQYRPIIVNTIHGDVANPYREFVDVLVCIHQAGFDRNLGKRIIIENCPLIDKSCLSTRLTSNHQVCFASRFHPYCITEETLDIYGKLKGEVFIYGYSKGSLAGNTIKQLAKRHSNIRIMPWSNSIEHEIVKHSIYAYLPPTFNSHLCYGLNVMEAAALAIPIVAIPRQNRQEYLKDNYNGFITRSREEFVEKCNNLLSDDQLYCHIKSNAINHAQELVNTMPNDYFQLYNKLLNS